jgi:hypothetical protein
MRAANQQRNPLTLRRALDTATVLRVFFRNDPVGLVMFGAYWPPNSRKLVAKRSILEWNITCYLHGGECEGLYVGMEYRRHSKRASGGAAIRKSPSTIASSLVAGLRDDFLGWQV